MIKNAAPALAMCLAVNAALAGRPCEDAPQTTAQVARGMNLAQATAAQLDATGATVVILARAGQDLSKYGLNWSHLGFVYRDESEGRPVWRVVHKLNVCGSARGELYRQGLGEFFLDRPQRYDATFVVLKPALQAALLPLLRDNARVRALHEPRYNMLAYPWATTYQQSNQWVLETLASVSVDPLLTRRGAAQAWLKAQGYQPSDIRLSTAERLGARLTRANIAFDDHPMGQRMAGHIETTTVDSMLLWLPKTGLSEDAVVVRQP